MDTKYFVISSEFSEEEIKVLCSRIQIQFIGEFYLLVNLIIYSVLR